MAQAYRKDDLNKNMNGRVFINFSIRANVALQVDQICDSLQIDRSKFFKSLLSYVLRDENAEGFIGELYSSHVEEAKIKKAQVSRRSKPVVYIPVEVSEEEVVEDNTPRRGRGRPRGSKNKPKLQLVEVASTESEMLIEE